MLSLAHHLYINEDHVRASIHRLETSLQYANHILDTPGHSLEDRIQALETRASNEATLVLCYIKRGKAKANSNKGVKRGPNSTTLSQEVGKVAKSLGVSTSKAKAKLTIYQGGLCSPR